MKRRPIVLNLLLSGVFVFLTMMKLSGQTTDSLSLTKESDHFAFYSAKGDIGVLDSLANILEDNYARITNRLGVQIEKKIKVNVFPDVGSFHVAIKYPDAPDWVVGSCNGDELLMVSPLNPGSVHTYESLMQVIVHEFVHIAVHHANGSTRLPQWLNEGYAQYEAGQINERVRKSVASGFHEKVPPAWAQLNNTSSMEFGRMNGYALSATIVEFLVAAYGVDTLVSLIKKPENIESIYGVPESTLEKQWIHYIRDENAE